MSFDICCKICLFFVGLVCEMNGLRAEKFFKKHLSVCSKQANFTLKLDFCGRKRSTEGQRHLGAVIGSQEFKDLYCREKVLALKGELEVPSEIARSQPHDVYTVFIHEGLQIQVYLFHAHNRVV